MKMPVFVLAASLAATAQLAACHAVGEGVKPVSAAIQPRGGVQGATSTKIYQCLNSALSFLLTFSDGEVSDFASRATFTSSDPTVVQVSNADIPVPGSTTGQVYSRGVLIPGNVGTANITATYLSFTQTITVNVGTIENLRISPTAAYLAPATLQTLSLIADLDGLPTVLNNSATWQITMPNTAIATIDSATGIVTGVAAGSGLVAQAQFASCGQTASANIEVSPLQSLALYREFGSSNTNLIVGTTEAIYAVGTLADGRNQDLSTQSTFTSSNPDTVSFSLGNLANATAAGDPVSITATLGSTGIISPPLTLKPVPDTLVSVAISPTNSTDSPTITVRGGYTQQFTATGSYASGATQPITRHVAWTLSDYTLGSIFTSSSSGIVSTAGLFTAATASAGKTVTVTGTNPNATTTTAASATVTLE
jgi:hypothetical protein